MTIITHNQTHQSSRFRRNFTGERFLMETATMATARMELAKLLSTATNGFG